MGCGHLVVGLAVVTALCPLFNNIDLSLHLHLNILTDYWTLGLRPANNPGDYSYCSVVSAVFPSVRGSITLFLYSVRILLITGHLIPILL